MQLIEHIHSHDPAMADKVIYVQTVDHPTDGQVVACARSYFRAADQIR